MATPASNEPAPLRLFVGLGNPGREYEKSRHNLGFLALQLYAERQGLAWSHSGKWPGDSARGDAIHLLKPTTYMNRSGLAVSRYAAYYGIAPGELLVVVDDVALPLGYLRVRAGGSSGGHNGLQSVIDHLGTETFPRLRLGIGAQRGDAGMVGHVLGSFSKEEKDAIDPFMELASEALETIQEKGVTEAANLYNKKVQSNEPDTQL